MNRLYLLPLTLLALGLVAWNTGLEAAQEPHPAIEVHRITDNLHMLGSGSTTGGNIALLIAEHGVVLVDTKNEGYGPDILEHVRRLTDKPVTDHHQLARALRPQWGQYRIPGDGAVRGAGEHQAPHGSH